MGNGPVSPPGGAGGDWREWSQFVLKELERDNELIEHLREEIQNLKVEIATMKTKIYFLGAAIGAGGGAVGTAIVQALLGGG